MSERFFNVGKIVNTHGIKGEVRVIKITDFEERFLPGSYLYLFKNDDDNPLKLTISNHRKHKQFDLLQFDGYDDVNDVEPFKGGMLKISEEDLLTLDEGEYYYHEIIGCNMYTTDGEYIGQVKEILSPGANDVWVVKRQGEKDELIRYIDDVVKEVNHEKKEIKIQLMEGLLD